MPPFDVTPDLSTQTLHVTLRDFWDLPTLERYIEALIAQSSRLDPERGRWLIDASEFDVQPSDVAAMMAKRFSDGRLKTPSMVAIVQPRTIAGMQSRRVAPHFLHRVYTTMAEARMALDLPPLE